MVLRLLLEGLMGNESTEIIACWCGAKGTYEELFDESGLEEGCGGTGSINCFCGGDQCVCHHHGDLECFGCEDCQEDEEDGWLEEEDEP